MTFCLNRHLCCTLQASEMELMIVFVQMHTYLPPAFFPSWGLSQSLWSYCFAVRDSVFSHILSKRVTEVIKSTSVSGRWLSHFFFQVHLLSSPLIFCASHLAGTSQFSLLAAWMPMGWETFEGFVLILSPFPGDGTQRQLDLDLGLRCKDRRKQSGLGGKASGLLHRQSKEQSLQTSVSIWIKANAMIPPLLIFSDSAKSTTDIRIWFPTEMPDCTAAQEHCVFSAGLLAARPGAAWAEEITSAVMTKLAPVLPVRLGSGGGWKPILVACFSLLRASSSAPQAGPRLSSLHLLCGPDKAHTQNKSSSCHHWKHSLGPWLFVRCC